MLGSCTHYRLDDTMVSGLSNYVSSIHYRNSLRVFNYSSIVYSKFIGKGSGAPEAIQKCGGKITVQATFVLQKLIPMGNL